MSLLRPLRIIHEYVIAYTLLDAVGSHLPAVLHLGSVDVPLLPRRLGTAAGRFGIMADSGLLLGVGDHGRLQST